MHGNAALSASQCARTVLDRPVFTDTFSIDVSGRKRLGSYKFSTSLDETRIRSITRTSHPFPLGHLLHWSAYSISPFDTDTIRNTTLSLLNELHSPDDFHGDTAFRLQQLDNSLHQWNTDGQHADVLHATRARLEQICSSITQNDMPSDACRTFLAPLPSAVTDR
jgi:hypothetical protein